MGAAITTPNKSEQIRGDQGRNQHTCRMDTQGLGNDPRSDNVIECFVN